MRQVWLLSLLGAAALPRISSGEIYTYLDSNGVYTITNIPPEGDVTIIKKLDEYRSSGGMTVPLGLRPVTPPETYDSHIDETCRLYGVDPDLVRAVIWVESNYNPRAVSNKGAKGLMQLIPDTGKRFGVKDLFDPEQNITGGVKYLRFLMELFRGNTSLALASYNAGEETVQRYNGIPPYRETRDYVKKISTIYGRDLQSAVKTPIYKVEDASGSYTYTNTPPAKPSAGQTVQKVLK